MSILDSIISAALGGGNMANSPLQPILAQILNGLASSGTQGSGQGGFGGAMGGAQGGGLSGGLGGALGGLLERFTQAGHGAAANSWVSNGPNQSIDPNALHQVFGQEQVSQWSQQTGIPTHDLLSQLSQYLPNAVNQMTPNGRLP